MSRKRYSAEDDQVILQKVRENSSNLQKAFRIASREIGHSPASINHRYYRVLSKGNACFVTVSKNKAYVNKKILKDTTEEKPVSESIFSKILKWLKWKK